MRKVRIFLAFLALSALWGCGLGLVGGARLGFEVGEISDYSRQPLFRPIFERELARVLSTREKSGYTVDINISRVKIDSSSLTSGGVPTQSTMQAEFTYTIKRGGEVVFKELSFIERERFKPIDGQRLYSGEEEAMRFLSERMASRLADEVSARLGRLEGGK